MKICVLEVDIFNFSSLVQFIYGLRYPRDKNEKIRAWQIGIGMQSKSSDLVRDKKCT